MRHLVLDLPPPDSPLKKRHEHIRLKTKNVRSGRWVRHTPADSSLVLLGRTKPRQKPAIKGRDSTTKRDGSTWIAWYLIRMGFGVVFQSA